MADDQPMPTIVGVMKMGQSIHVDEYLLRDHFYNEESLKMYLQIQFAEAAGSEITKHLLLSVDETPGYISGKKYWTEYGFIPDLDVFYKGVRAIVDNAFNHGYAKAKSEEGLITPNQARDLLGLPPAPDNPFALDEARRLGHVKKKENNQ